MRVEGAGPVDIKEAGQFASGWSDLGVGIEVEDDSQASQVTEVYKKWYSSLERETEEQY